MKNKIILLLFLCLCGGNTAIAQVATASLDSTKMSRSATANSWRFGSTLSIQTVQGNHAPAGVWTESDTLESNGHFAWQPSNMTLEIANITYVDKIWDPASDVLVNSDRSSTGLNISVRGNDELSIGVSYQSISTLTTGIVEQKETNYGGSFGMRFGGLFVASGMRIHKEEVQGYENKSWKSTEMGAAYMLGSPDLYQVRIEHAIIKYEGEQLPTVDYLGTQAANQESISSLELIYKGFYMGYHLSENKRSKILLETSDRINTDAEYGFGWRDMDYTFMLYKVNGLETYGTQELRSLRYRLTFGINFI